MEIENRDIMIEMKQANEKRVKIGKKIEREKEKGKENSDGE
jgi:hypothetical protein